MYPKNVREVGEPYTLLVDLLYLISILVNFSYELGQIMTIYDFLEARWVIFGNVWTNSNFSCEQ